MTNRNAEKIRQRRERLKNNQTPTAVSSEFNSFLFWILLIVILSIIGFLIYQFITSNSTSQFLIAIAVSAIALLILLVFYLPKFYVRSLHIEPKKGFEQERERLKLEDDTRKTVAQIVGGAVLLGSLLFTYNTFRLQQEGFRLQQENFRLDQEAQFTDRFTKAVEQIGNDKLEVRLGGLYALERIAKDSPKDHRTVMEILTAYIREKSKKVEFVKTNSEDSGKDNGTKQLESAEKLPTDIQAAFTIIGRRKIEQDVKSDGINLNGIDLSSVDLSGVNLSRVNFKNANLNRVKLDRADLREADLSHTDLRGANLSAANLRGADLYVADLRGANLRYAQVSFENLGTAVINLDTKLYANFPNFTQNKRRELLKLSESNLIKLEMNNPNYESNNRTN